MQLSTLPYLEYISGVYGTIFIGFGILWFVDPAKALSFFELPYPEAIDQTKSLSPPSSSTRGKKSASAATAPAASAAYDAKKAIDALGAVYAIRDVFMGVAIYAAAFSGDGGNRASLGWIMAAAGCVAGVDGAVCKFIVGKGEMSHWSYAPVLVVLGIVMLGGFDDWIVLDIVVGWMTEVVKRVGWS